MDVLWFLVQYLSIAFTCTVGEEGPGVEKTILSTLVEIPGGEK